MERPPAQPAARTLLSETAAAHGGNCSRKSKGRGAYRREQFASRDAVSLLGLMPTDWRT